MEKNPHSYHEIHLFVQQFEQNGHFSSTCMELLGAILLSCVAVICLSLVDSGLLFMFSS